MEKPEPKYSSKRKEYMREYMRYYKKYGKGFRKNKKEPKEKKEYNSKRKEYMREYMIHYKKYGKGFRKEKQEIRLQECYGERLSGTSELLEMEIAWLEMTGTTSSNPAKHNAYNVWKYRDNKKKGISYKKVSNKEIYRAQKEGMPVYNERFLPYIEELLKEIKNNGN